MKKEIGIFGLGKMGGGMALHLREQSWKVVGYARHKETVQKYVRQGIKGSDSPTDLIGKLTTPRVVVLMVPAGRAVDDLLFGKDGIAKRLSKGDTVIDSGNSFYKDAAARAKKLKKFGVTYMDLGFSGGPLGARRGGCLMIGGDKKTFKRLEPLFKALAQKDGYRFFEGVGAGHFVKMVHNGIEYGMMQAIGEGFEILKKSKFKLNLTKVAEIYNTGSVIESRLVGWLLSGFKEYGEDLGKVSGTVGHTGEGEWTAKAARELGVSAEIIEKSFQFRVKSGNMPSYTGKVVSTLRNQFGGHSIGK